MKITIEVDLATGAVSTTTTDDPRREATDVTLSTPPSIGVDAGACAGAGLAGESLYAAETQPAFPGTVAPSEVRPGFHVDTFPTGGNGPAPGALDAGAPA